MKFYSLLIFCLTFIAIKANGQGKVEILPATPMPGDSLIITYYPGKNQKLPDPVQLNFTYSNFYELPGNTNLAREGNTWKAAFKLPPYAVFATFVLKIGDSTIKPGENRHYEIYVYDQQKQRVKNSYLYQAYSLGAQEGKHDNLQENQAKLYAEELSHYPDNYAARLSLLAYEISKAGDKEKPELYKKANDIIAQMFYTDPGNMAFTNRTTMGYLIMGEKSRLDSLREVIKKEYPLSEAGYELRISDLTSLADTAEMVKGLELMLENENEKNAGFLEGAHETLFEYYAAKGNARKALHHLSFLNKEFTPYTPAALKQQAEILFKNAVSPETALKLAQNALAYADTFPISLIRYFPETGYLPSFVSREERKQSVAKISGQLKSLMALIQLQMNNNRQAKELISQALTLSQDEETLKNAGDYFMHTQDFQSAFNQYRKIAYENPDDTLSYQLMAVNYEKWKGNLAGLEKYEAEIKNHWRDVMNKQLEKEIISIPLPDVVTHFVDLKGRPLSPELINNKIVIMDFWATWCVPCMKAMPFMEEVYKEYKNDPDVVFMIVNSGSQNELQDAQNWWGNDKFSFPVYYNKDRTIGDKMGFNLIPATFIIDRNKNIRFKTLGFEGSGMTRKIAAQIELLKK